MYLFVSCIYLVHVSKSFVIKLFAATSLVSSDYVFTDLLINSFLVFNHAYLCIDLNTTIFNVRSVHALYALQVLVYTNIYSAAFRSFKFVIHI